MQVKTSHEFSKAPNRFLIYKQLTRSGSAPNDLNCSSAASRMSNPRTMAPMALAEPAAARPATPPPLMRICTSKVKSSEQPPVSSKGIAPYSPSLEGLSRRLWSARWRNDQIRSLRGWQLCSRRCWPSNSARRMPVVRNQFCFFMQIMEILCRNKGVFTLF